MTVCVVCYSSNALFRNSSDAAASCIVSLLSFFWQLGGAIYNYGAGSVLTITESEFDGNIASVSDGLSFLCAILQTLHFEIALMLLLVVLFHYYAFDRLLVVLFTIMVGRRSSQDLSLREIQHQMEETISIMLVVMLLAMMLRTHSIILTALPVIIQMVSVIRRSGTWKKARGVWIIASPALSQIRKGGHAVYQAAPTTQ